MEIYKGTVKSYTVTELSEKAQEKAYQNWLSSGSYFFDGDELRETLDRFCEIFDVTCNDWHYDCSYHYNFKLQYPDNTRGLSGQRLTTYIWNNYASYIQTGKFYSISKFEDGKPTFKTRYSKILLEMDNCPLTGVCWDIDILTPVIETLTYKRTYQSYAGLIDACLDAFFATASKQYEYCGTKEYFIETADANEWEYDESGNSFTLPAGFIAA